MNRTRLVTALLGAGLSLSLVSAAGCSSSADDGSTAAAQSGAEVESSPTPTPSATSPSRALDFPAGPLPPGRNSTADYGVTLVSFKVPDGWWGEQSSETEWMIRWGERLEHARATLWVHELELPFDEAVANFKKVKNLDTGRPKTMQVDGKRVLLFRSEVTRGQHALLDKAFGIPIDVVGWVDTRQAFIDLGTRAMLVRFEFPKGDKYLPQALRAMKSFRFDE
jgi:hypothetical protein